MKIVIHGYYGFGNFGDDLLCKVSIEFCRNFFHHPEIYILTYAPQPGYLAELTEGAVTLINDTRHVNADVLLFGGGGLFFDFDKGSPLDLLLNFTLKSIPPKMYYGLMEQAGKTFPATKKIAAGIGVGKFTSSSPKYRHKLLQLLEFDHIYLRDRISHENLARVARLNTRQATDLAFASGYWVPENLPPSQEKRVLFVLRDWKWNDSSNLKKAFLWMDSLISLGYECDVASFDPLHDKILSEKCAEQNIDLISWNPSKMTFHDYVRQLNQYDIFVSSRAHGILTGLILGKKCLSVLIEPKLDEIRNMASGSVGSISPEASPAEFIEIFHTYINSFNREVQQKEIRSNEELIRVTFKEIADFINS